ncbi:hypothetical protein QBC47DRAFT_432234 [Echria macrotheca]|uniref:Uncharacterized protein n=1 Tax=Echria macrotheca TaxID=438768 RepID=A0AAJ0B6L0_9PEZI|nr:hypothetical protein QBC47DRAFT_432234 [Echria macrotheca]
MTFVNPIRAPTGFEIRKLEEKHADWAAAIISHSNVFHSPVWARLYPDEQTKRAYATFEAARSLMALNIASGLSYGVFDTNYQFKRPESAAEGGKLYWDTSANGLHATGADLIEQMDFPLASIAMAYDAGDPTRDGTEWAPLVACLPRFATLFHVIMEGDGRDPEAKKPKSMGVVVERGGTSTRRDYEGRGLAKAMGHFVLYEWANQGFRVMQVGAANQGVVNIFTKPPAPFKGEIVARMKTLEYEEEVDGEKIRPFAVCGDVPCVDDGNLS